MFRSALGTVARCATPAPEEAVSKFTELRLNEVGTPRASATICLRAHRPPRSGARGCWSPGGRDTVPSPPLARPGLRFFRVVARSEDASMAMAAAQAALAAARTGDSPDASASKKEAANASPAPVGSTSSAGQARIR